MRVLAMAALLGALAAPGLGLTRFGLAGDKQPPAQPVNINTASVAELQKLPGIGPATAKAIVSYRQRHGPFRRVEELLIVRGISRSRLNALRRYITVQSQKPK